MFAHPGRQVAASQIDPYLLTQSPVAAEQTGNSFGIVSTDGKTLVHPGNVSGQNDLVFIVCGQSNSANYMGTAHYLPTNASVVQEFSVFDGGCRLYQEPLTGAGGFATGRSAWLGRLGDKLINAGTCNRVIFCPISIGNTKAADWAPGGICHGKLLVAIRRLAAVGRTPSAILFQDGESDNLAGTTQASLQASYGAMITASRNENYNGPWFISQTSWSQGNPSATVIAAQTAMVNHASGIWQGPNTDQWTGTTYRLVGDDHFNDTGSDTVAGAWQTQLHLYGAPF